MVINFLFLFLFGGSLSQELLGELSDSPRPAATNHYTLQLNTSNPECMELPGGGLMLPVSAANKPVSLNFTVLDGFGFLATEELRAKLWVQESFSRGLELVGETSSIASEGVASFDNVRFEGNPGLY